jgi:hypothetical protein
MGTEGPFPGVKALLGRDADHSPLSSTEVENEKDLYLLSPKSFRLWRESNLDRPVVQPVTRHCTDWPTPLWFEAWSLKTWKYDERQYRL